MSYQWIILLVLLSTGCTRYAAFGDCAYRVKTGECYQAMEQDSDLIQTTYQAVDRLTQNIPEIALPAKGRILVTTVANLDKLDNSSSLGRLLSEQLAARFVQHGFNVIEARLHDSLLSIPHTGEFFLSRKQRNIGKKQFADVAIVGTYAEAKDTVYITLKMLNFDNSKILSSYAYSLPIGPNTAMLLQKSYHWWW